MQDADRVTPLHDQLGFFLFLACALHLMLILGIGFTPASGHSATPRLEVILAHYKSARAPEQARFVAQSNQAGSGGEASQSATTTRRQGVFSDNRLRQPDAAARFQKPGAGARQPTLADTVNDTADSILRAAAEPQPEPLPAGGADWEIVQLGAAIASLEARLDEQEQALAEPPVVSRRTARAAVDAAYLHAWRTRVEAIGNRHYPVASSRYGIYGDLRLLVAVRADGGIDNIEVLSSSGHAVLDEAAIHIVRMSAPFAPFPPELRETTERLEIIRTWKFRQNRLRSIQG